MARNKKPVNVEEWHHSKSWVAAHRDKMTFGQRIADSVASGMGSWTFIIIQTCFVIVWMALNVVEVFWRKWDPYPFILLNLLFSTQAAYAAPIIMMSQNRSSERDRFQAAADFKTNVEARKDIESVQVQLSRIENEKLDRILAILAEPSAAPGDSAPAAGTPAAAQPGAAPSQA